MQGSKTGAITVESKNRALAWTTLFRRPIQGVARYDQFALRESSIVSSEAMQLGKMFAPTNLLPALKQPQTRVFSVSYFYLLHRLACKWKGADLTHPHHCLLYTSDAADEEDSVD